MNYCKLLWTHVVREKGNKAWKYLDRWYLASDGIDIFVPLVLLCYILVREKKASNTKIWYYRRTHPPWMSLLKKIKFVCACLITSFSCIFFIYKKKNCFRFCEGDSAGCEWLQSRQPIDLKVIIHKDLAMTPSKFIKCHLIKGVLKVKTIINVKSIRVSKGVLDLLLHSKGSTLILFQNPKLAPESFWVGPTDSSCRKTGMS